MAPGSPILACDRGKLDGLLVERPSRNRRGVGRPASLSGVCARLPATLLALRRAQGNGGQPIAQPRTFVLLAHLKTLKLRLSLFNRPGQNRTWRNLSGLRVT